MGECVMRLALTLAAGIGCGGVMLLIETARTPWPAARADRWMAPRFDAVIGERALTLFPGSWRRSLAVRLAVAGDNRAGQLEAAAGLRLLTLSVGMAVFVLVIAGAGSDLVVMVGAVVLAVSVAAAPELALRRRTVDRARRMRRDLPRHLDLLTISVEAGLGFDQALDRVVRALPGPLADEFARMAGEVRAGMPRVDSLRAMADRCPIDEVRVFTMAMVQADTFGISVGPVLRSQAVEMRTRHRQAAQLQAQKAPVKLLLPMVLCLFPALLVVLAGPALLSVRSLFAG